MESNFSRYFIQLAYNGTKYFGWQRQPAHISVQQVLEEKLSMILNKPTVVVGCGRTDTGVHAKDYIAHVDLATDANVDKLTHQLNATLPKDVVVYGIYKVPVDWHARFTALDRSYEYHVHFYKSPFKQDNSWFVKHKLNHDNIKQACSYLVGEKDFTSFAKVHTDVNNHVCNVKHASWEVTSEGAVFYITANRFLRNMVRAIMGTLIKVGEGKILPEDVQKIIEEKNRNAAGQSVPPHGLFLSKIKYPKL